jgi:hypothetical protein
VFTVKANQHRQPAPPTSTADQHRRPAPSARGAAGDALAARAGITPAPASATAEQRVIDVLPAPDHLDFPGGTHVFQLTRHRTNRTTGTHQTETAHDITSLTTDQAAPAQIAAYPRGHRQIQNQLHRSATSPTAKTPPNCVPAPHHEP